jgi:hypothetical protein
LKKIIALAGLLLAAAGSAMASTGYYLVTVYENEDEKSLDFKWWQRGTARSPVGSPEYGFGYGVTKRWYSEIYATYINTEFTGNFARDTTWQNDYLLTQGQYPFDLAIHTNLLDMRDGSTGIEFGPIVQTDFGRTQVNAGLLFERSYRTPVANRMQMRYQWQAKYRWHPMLQFGVMGFGELGDWDDWATRSLQSHRAGPMIAGTLPLGSSGQSIKYDLAWLVGNISAAHSNSVSLRLQYIF